MTTNRKLVFVSDYYYHVYNRGVEKRKIFLSKADYQRFQSLLDFYRFQDPPLRYSHVTRLENKKRYEVLQAMYGGPVHVEIFAWCLMPNHFHLLLKQTKENGISTYIANLLNSYTRYFNTKYERIGPLFQGTFKAKFIETDEQLLHVSRYIHLNPVVASLGTTKNIPSYQFSSLQSYISSLSTNKSVNTELILSQFSTPDDYLQFVQDQADYTKTLKDIEEIKIDN